MTSRKVDGLPATTYVYDPMNRLDLVVHSPASGLPDIDYDYDENGNLQWLHFGDVDRTYTMPTTTWKPKRCRCTGSLEER